MKTKACLPFVTQYLSKQNNVGSTATNHLFVRRKDASLFLDFKRFSSHLKTYQLPLLSFLTEAAQLHVENAHKTYFIATQHLLPTTYNLIEALIQLGFRSENMLLIGKPYSTVPNLPEKLRTGLGVSVVEDKPLLPFEKKFLFNLGEYEKYTQEKTEAAWEKATHCLKSKRDIEQIIILDEGGHLLERIPRSLLSHYKIVGIEQTRGGLYNRDLPHRPFPIIHVASSALKREWEAKIIAKSVIETLEKKLPKESYYTQQFGVLGTGAIGLAVIEYLNSKGCKVFYYDANQSAMADFKKRAAPNMGIASSSTEALVRNSDWILGCTGKDVSQAFQIEELSGNNKYFVSCSSEDREYKTALQKLRKYVERIKLDPLQDLTFYSTNQKDSITFISGGFPVNFTRTPECDPPEIDLTRALLLASCIQAQQLLSTYQEMQEYPAGLMLDPHLQLKILEACVQEYPHLIPQEDLRSKSPLFDWIVNHSGGVFYSPNLQNGKSLEQIEEARYCESFPH